jgi:hypothetical protein
MKKSILTFFLLLIILGSVQTQPSGLPFQVVLEEVFISNAPGLQSYAVGVHNERWIAMCGRISGLHGHNPFNSFPPDSANKHIWMMDPSSGQVWSQPVSVLAPSIAKQLEATNTNFVQHDSLLYVIGGYGYDAASNQYDTWPYLLVVKLPLLHDALVQGTSPAAAFTQMQDNRMAVTGGYLGLMDSTFYLVGGHKFTGRYNPHGNPSYTQTYTDAIRMFTLKEIAGTYQIQDYREISDAQELHRRDYNMVPQVFPDGKVGFTAFSGVFRPNVDLPWFNTVDIHDTTYYPIPEQHFKQEFNQYHTAHLPVYAQIDNAMHTLFFGGIGMYTWDSLNQIAVVDSAVPFVNTISVVSRFADSSMTERVLSQRMPALLGASAEFIPLGNLPLMAGEILDFDLLPPGKTSIGHIYGGIQSSQPNIFMQTTGSSHATNRIFKVSLIKTSTALNEAGMPHLLQAYPNPASGLFAVHLPWNSLHPEAVLHTLTGQNIPVRKSLQENSLRIQTVGLAPGMYILHIREGGQEGQAKILIR